MLKNTPFKKIGLITSAILILAACQPPTDAEDSAVVLEKMITQASKVYETQTQMEVSFKDTETGEWGEITLTATEETDATDLENLESDSKLEFSADINMLEYNSDEGEESLEQVTVDASARVRVIGKDIYAQLEQLDLGGSSPQVAQANASLSFVLGAYMDEVIYVSLETLEPFLEQMEEASGQVGPSFSELMAYSQDQAAKDLAESQLLKASVDHGPERISTLSGKEWAYHYEIEIDAAGMQAFLEKMDEQFDLFTEEEIKEVFEMQDPSLEEVMEVVNTAMKIDVWIGMEDYHPYRVELTSDLEKIQEVIDKIEALDDTFVTEADRAALEQGEFSMSLVTESQPMSKVNIERPAEDDLLDMNPMLQGFLGQFDPSLLAPQATMSDAEIEQMMQELGLDEEGLALPEDVQLEEGDDQVTPETEDVEASETSQEEGLDEASAEETAEPSEETSTEE